MYRPRFQQLWKMSLEEMSFIGKSQENTKVRIRQADVESK